MMTFALKIYIAGALFFALNAPAYAINILPVPSLEALAASQKKEPDDKDKDKDSTKNSEAYVPPVVGEDMNPQDITPKKSAEHFLSIYADAAVSTRRINHSNKHENQTYVVKNLVTPLVEDSIVLLMNKGFVHEYYLENKDNLTHLHLDLEDSENVDAKGTLSYAFKGLTWSSYYAIEVSENYTTASLNNWIVIKNTTDTFFPKASITFLEGKSPLKDSKDLSSDYNSDGKPSRLKPSKSITTYNYKQLVDIPAKSVKQLQWFHKKDVPVTKEYQINIPKEAFDDLDGKLLTPNVETWLSFPKEKDIANRKNLPAGYTTIYHKNGKGVREVVERFHMRHLLKPDVIQFRVPHLLHADNNKDNDFGVTSTLQQTEFHNLAETVNEIGYRLSLKNDYDVSVSIKVVVNFPDKKWRITRENIVHQQDGKNRVFWVVDVPSKGTIDLKYRLNLTGS